MLRSLIKCSPLSALLGEQPVKRFHWVYKDGENGYDDKRIEKKLMSLSEGGDVHLKIDNEVAVLTIDNPAKKNALTGTMTVSLREIVKTLWDCEKSKAVVLCGEGAAFCSGLDLSLAAKMTNVEDGIDMCMYMQNTLTAFQLLPMITVAAIRGPALGGGAEIITAADFRLMYPDSKIRFVQKKMGITPGWGGATRLNQTIGQRKAMYLLASADYVDCKSALLIGLADALVSDPEDLQAAHGALEWLERNFRLSDTDRNVFTAIKASTRSSSHDADGRLLLDHMMRREKDILANVWGKPPNLKALRDIKTKR